MGDPEPVIYPKPRRLQRLTVSLDLIVDMCKSGTRSLSVVANALPGDARPLVAATNPLTGNLEIMIESDHFAPVAVADEVPQCATPIFEALHLDDLPWPIKNRLSANR